MITLNIRQILQFFDEDKKATKHSNAIKTIIGEELMLALLLEYFKREGICASVIPQSCTTGNKKGNRLDAWVKVQDPISRNPFFYQVEVKSWSAHGIGRQGTFIDSNWIKSEFCEYKRKIWGHYWENSRFSMDAVNKVLTPMLSPDSNVTVKPLACLWEMMHPEGDENPFFTVEIDKNSDFQKVYIFSVSSFLRNLSPNEPELMLNLPVLSKRLEYLNKIFTTK